MRQRGQVWSLDYSIGLILFLVAFIISATLLARTFLRTDAWTEVRDSADALSEQIVSTGYPHFWREDDVVVAGLVTDGRLSMRKAERLASLAEASYLGTKSMLNLRHDYSLLLMNASGNIVPIGNHCSIGNATETKTIEDRTKPVSYYHGALFQLLVPLIDLNATTFDDTNLTGFLSSLGKYELAVVEDATFSLIDQPFDSEKAAALEEFTLRGGTLLILGNLSMSLFDLNISPVGVVSTATATGGPDMFFNLSENVNGIPATAMALTPGGQPRYISIASLPDGRDYLAVFSHGDGDVLFVGGLDGTLNVSGQPFADYITERLNATVLSSIAACTSVDVPAADQLVRVRRLLPWDGKVLSLEVTVWE